MDNEDNNVEESVDNEQLDDNEEQGYDNSPVGYSPSGPKGLGRGIVGGLISGMRRNPSLKEKIEKDKNKNKPPVSSNNNNEKNNNSSNVGSDKSKDEVTKSDQVTENNEEEQNNNSSSLLKFSGKFRLSLKIKITILIIALIFLFLLFFVLIGSAYILIDKVKNGSESGDNLSYSDIGDDSGFWWPVGSKETTTKNGKVYASGQPALTEISSGFESNRCIGGSCNDHYGIDVGSGGEINVYNLIATKSGSIVEISNDCEDNGDLNNQCNGGLGNYVTIDHGNGYYSRYQHMAKDSITVNKGDNVDQGQVIGKIGQSGRCQGAHLHFQIHIGGTSNSYAVDPTKYVDASNPRPVVKRGSGNSSDLVKMIQYFEGTGPVAGDNYIAYKYSYDVLTIGHGVTIPYNREKFKNHGINPDSITIGTKLPISVVDAIEADIVNDHYNSVVSTLNGAGLSLKQNQIDALVSRHYNTGNIKGFVSAYNKYGDTDALFVSYMSSPVTARGKYLAGLARRRKAEWKLFHEGIYTY